MAQLEVSVATGVEHLRSTGSAVDLITEHLGFAVRELLAERRELGKRLVEFGHRLEAVAQLDQLRPINERMNMLRQQLQALPIDLQPLYDRLETLAPTDLGPLHHHVETLRNSLIERVEALAPTDLAPLHDQLNRLADQVSALPSPPDLNQINERLHELRQQLLALPTIDLQPLHDRLQALTPTDLAPLHDQLNRLAEQVSALPSPPDLNQINERLHQVHEGLLALPTIDLQPLHDLFETLTPTDLLPLHHQLNRLAEQISALPSPPDPNQINERLHELRQQLLALPTIDLQPLHDRLQALTPTDLAPLHDQLDRLAEQVSALPSPPDLNQINERLHQVHEGLLALPTIDLQPLHDLFEAVDQPDLAPIHQQLTTIVAAVAALQGTIAEGLSAIPVIDLTPVHERLAATHRELAEHIDALPAPDLGPLHDQLNELRVAVVEALAALPLHTDDAVRADVARLNEQLDGLRTTLADRFDAIQTPDLAPFHDQLDRLAEQVSALPSPPDLNQINERLHQVHEGLLALPTIDLQPLHERLAATRRELAEHIDALPAPDLGPLHDQLNELRVAVVEGLAALPVHTDDALGADVARLNEQLDGLRTTLADRFDAIQTPDLAPFHDHLDRLEQRVAAIPAPDLSTLHDHLARVDVQIASLPQAEQVASALEPHLESLRAAVEPTARLEGIETTTTAVRDDLSLVSKVLVGLTERALASEVQLDGLVTGQKALGEDQRAHITNAVGELSGSVTKEVRDLGSQLAELVNRTAALDDLQTDLASTREVLAALSTKADRAEEAGRAAADGQALSLARVTAATDGLSTSLGSIRSSLSAAVETAGQASVAAIEERLNAGLAGVTTGLDEGIDAQLRAHLGDLSIPQLRLSVAELAQQVVEARADDRALREVVLAVDQRLERLGAEDLPPVRATLDHVRAQIEALPAPDLGPVASQLARLSATIVSQTRHEPATSDHVGALSRSLDEAMQQLAQQFERQAEATMEIWTHVARQPSEAERVDDLREEVGRATAGLQATIEQMAVEVVATRDIIERRPSSRWRRGSDEDELSSRELLPAEPTELEQRVDRALSAMDERLASLAEVVERAASYADDAATAATAALRVATTSPPDITKAPAKKAVVKKAPAKKAPAKKAVVARLAPKRPRPS